MIKPFKPDGAMPFPGILLCVGVSFAGAVASGYLLGFISHLGFSLLVIWPLLMGMGAGAATWKGISLGAVRNVPVAWLLAGAAGVLSVLASHHINYLFVKSDLVKGTVEAANEDGEPLTPEEAAQLVEAQIEAETGAPGFTGFLKLEAKQGTAISRRGHTTQVDEDGTLILWGLETLGALAVSIAVARKQAAEPFCTQCNAWYKGTGTAFLDATKLDEIKRQFETASLARLREMTSSPAGAHVSLVCKECSSCTVTTPVMTLENVSFDRKNRETRKMVGAWSVPRATAHQTMAELTARPA